MFSPLFSEFEPSFSPGEQFNDFDQDVIETIEDAPEQGIDIRGLYATLKEHPNLMDQRLSIGQLPPPLPQTDKTYELHRSYEVCIFNDFYSSNEMRKELLCICHVLHIFFQICIEIINQK